MSMLALPFTLAVALAALCSASPLDTRAPQPFTVPIKTVQPALALSVAGISVHVPNLDRSRASLLKGNVPGLSKKKRSSPKTIPAINWEYFQYTAEIGVGSPPTYYNLVIDTGSSNTFVGTGIKYVQTKTSINTGEQVEVTYGSGYFAGNEYLDQVTIGPGFAITNQSIGDALQYADFPGVDGIIGVGPTDLTQGTLSPDVNALIPTVIDNAFSQSLIPAKVLGVAFAPTLSNASVNGALTFGGVEAQYLKTITYTPVTATYPSNYYWGINVTSLDYAKGGSSTNLFKNIAGIVDTGTTLIYIADDFFAFYQSSIPGSTIDSTTGMLLIPSSSMSALRDLNFNIGGTTFTLSPMAQVVPQAEVTAYGGTPGNYYAYLGPIGADSGTGLDFIIGQKFLERFYSVFDTTNSRVGFSYTEYTFSNQ